MVDFQDGTSFFNQISILVFNPVLQTKSLSRSIAVQT